jgi:hypothetical protein
MFLNLRTFRYADIRLTQQFSLGSVGLHSHRGETDELVKFLLSLDIQQEGASPRS